jgi:hypothetical protein
MNVAILTAVAAALLFNLINETALSPGRFINRFAPCIQDQRTSFPCYGMYDLVALALCAVIFLIAASVIIVKTLRQNAPKLTKLP